MGYRSRDKPVHKSGRAGFVDARLEELRRRWENATDEREKNEAAQAPVPASRGVTKRRQAAALHTLLRE